MATTIHFWGVRGSVPSPPTTPELQQKMLIMLTAYHTEGCPADLKKFFAKYAQSSIPAARFYGGNTSCVEVVMDDQRFILDMGTGIRPLGVSLMPEMFAKQGLSIVFLLSHVHWDHIQGLPFFPPLYWNKAKRNIKNRWSFYGGTGWQQTAEDCLRQQMSESVFPVSWKKIEKITHHPISFADVYDCMEFSPNDGKTQVMCRELDHPQETYGWRLTSKEGKIIVYTTDNEPRDPNEPDERLVELASGADLWITDCQYTKQIYHGKDNGVRRHGWGHSYPEAVAIAAIAAKVNTVALFHHDPASSDEKIHTMEFTTRVLLNRMDAPHINVIAAYEGLTLTL